MKFGANLYRFTQYGADFTSLLEFVRTADELGYHHLRFLDHVVGIVAERHGGIASTPYTNQSVIHEIFVLLGYLAAVTKQIRLVPGVLALPQRQTVLVAKQAAEVDTLTGGRLTLGVGVGYNPVEFEALGASFGDRGKRFEEQIEVLRALWTEEVVTFHGRWHTITDTSLAPLPIQRPIPLWFGIGRTIDPIPPDPVLRRVGRLADGWLPLFTPDAAARIAIGKVHDAAREAGRDPDALTMEMTLLTEGKTPAQLIDEIKGLRDFGASQLNVDFGATTARGQIEGLKRFRDVIDAF